MYNGGGSFVFDGNFTFVFAYDTEMPPVSTHDYDPRFYGDGSLTDGTLSTDNETEDEEDGEFVVADGEYDIAGKRTEEKQEDLIKGRLAGDGTTTKLTYEVIKTTDSGRKQKEAIRTRNRSSKKNRTYIDRKTGTRQHRSRITRITTIRERQKNHPNLFGDHPT